MIKTKANFLTSSGITFGLIILTLGIFFRIAYLGEKIYWVDEVSTSMRINGYHKEEVIQELSSKSLINISELQQYQKKNPEKNVTDLINALKTSPEHAPLYFIITHWWVHIFGDSVTAIRSLSVFFSLLALPCIYYLTSELFNNYYSGIIASLLTAVSPFYIAYAQEARPYSLWIVTILFTNIILLKAIKNNHWLCWLGYSLSLILSLYTSLLSFLVLGGQIVYIAWEKTRIKNSLIAISCALLCFIPWLLVIINSWERLENNTTWMREAIDLIPMIAIWFYSIAIIFVESPISLSLNPLMISRIMIDVSLFILIGYSFYYLLTTQKHRIYLFIIFVFILPRLILIALDIIGNNQISTAPRYMIPLYLGIQLTLAYLLAEKTSSLSLTKIKFFPWRLIITAIISLGIMSSIFNIKQSPKYQKTRNTDNITLANIINTKENQLIISEKKNVLDLISLSYLLENNIKLKLIDDNWENYAEIFTQNQFKDIFLFNPSPKIISTLTKSSKYQLTEIYQPQLLIPNQIHLTLWKLENKLFW